MKVIAVLIPTFNIEYSLDVLSGITDYFRDKEVKVVIIQTRIPGINTGAFDYQYCTGFEYAKHYDIIKGIRCYNLCQRTLCLSDAGKKTP